MSLRHRLEYGAFRIFRGVLEALPESLALSFGAALGWLAGTVFRVRREVVEDNLCRAFPEKPAGWRRQVAGAAYTHLAREAVVTFRLGSTTRARIRERTEVDGLEEFEKDLALGRGVVLVGGHLGNWEMGGAGLAARGIPVDGVAQVQRNRLFDRDLRETRARLGLTIMSKQEAPRGVLASLRQGRVPALVADQNAAVAGIFVDFFGVPAATARGPAVFALRTGAPLWAGTGAVLPGRPHRYRVLLRRVEAELTGDPEADVEALTRSWVAILEEWVRQYPEQYFWHHKRWKTRPPIPEPGP